MATRSTGSLLRQGPRRVFAIALDLLQRCSRLRVGCGLIGVGASGLDQLGKLRRLRGREVVVSVSLSD